MGTIKSYIKQVKAQLTGDQDEVIAQRNYRTAKATVKGQLASLEADVVKQERAVEIAEEKLNKAKYPTTEINDAYYLSGIVSAQENMDYAQQSLDSTNKSIKFYTDLLAEFEAEVEA